MTKTAAFALLALFAATEAEAQPAVAPVAVAPVAVAPGRAPQSSSEKVRENPVAQYVLVKTVVGQAAGIVDARAKPVEPEGYNLLKYCWSPENVLGDWADRAGLTGEMVVRALETRSWQRDLARAGYPEAAVAEAIGRYEASLVAAGFTDAARKRAVETLVTDLNSVRRTAMGTLEIRAIDRCEAKDRSLALNYKTAPENGRARFIPYVLHQVCQTQQINPDDQIRCDYWINGRADGQMSFAGETVYSVRWADDTSANGRFDPDESRSDGTVTLRLRPPKATK